MTEKDWGRDLGWLNISKILIKWVCPPPSKKNVKPKNILANNEVL